MTRILILLSLLLYPISALAAGDMPAPDAGANDWIRAVYTAATSGEWKLVAGLVLVGVVAAFMRFTPIKPKSKPGKVTLAFALSLASTLGVALAAGAEFTVASVATAISTAGTAAGLWGWIRDYLDARKAAA